MTSTDPTSTPQPPDAAASTTPSGVDLARVALQAAKTEARKRGDAPGTVKVKRRVRAGRGGRVDGREPAGLAAVFQQLVTERAWEVPAAGGSLLQQWPDIAPDLARHVAAVGFDAEQGRLDLLPDSSAYATQLRMSTARLVALANQAVGRQAVRTIRVLPPGTARGPAVPEVTPAAAPASEAPVRTRQDASPGYRQALAALQAGNEEHGDKLTPAVRAAAQRQEQMLRARREPEKEFGDGQAALEELRAKAARQTSPDHSRARALQRLADERAGRAVPAPAVRRSA